ncbi:zincin-like metallopeptidase domain-containing protein, partial [Mesorhizobium sp.]|uniref:zincin-like metallopeptidase domain-containing protein n=1 Tax=Mesorhizobium sp. TaxID=1871066 RepID=UPI000FE8FA99
TKSPQTNATTTSKAQATSQPKCEPLYILADLGLAHHPRPDHAAYVASWLKVLKDDPRAIFTAASKAQAAADWMHARQPPS